MSILGKTEHREFMEALSEIRDNLRTELLKEIDLKVDNYRRQLWNGDWCCDDMGEFHMDMVDDSRFSMNDHYPVSIHWKGKSMNYCPFCGRKAQ